MTAARTLAPNVDAIARDLAKEHPDWNRERLYNEAHAAFVVRMRAYTNDVVKRVTADPVVMSAVRVQRAQQEARRMVRPQPDMTTLLSRERDRLMKHEGCTLEEAITRASETVRETMRLWERDHLQETSTILQRDAAIPVQLAAPRAPAAESGRTSPASVRSRWNDRERGARRSHAPRRSAGPHERTGEREAHAHPRPREAPAGHARRLSRLHRGIHRGEQRDRRRGRRHGEGWRAVSAVLNLTRAIGDSVERARTRVHHSPVGIADTLGGELRAAGYHLDRFLAGQAIDLTEQTLCELFDGIG